MALLDSTLLYYTLLLLYFDRGPNKKSKNEQTWLKYAEIQEPSTLSVNYSYNNFYDFRSSENK